MLSRFLRRLIAFALIAEGMLTVTWFAGRTSSLLAFGLVTTLVASARGGVGVLQFVSGWSLARHAPFARVLAQSALVLSAILMTIEIVGGLGSTNLIPSLRTPAVVAYWVYALVGVLILRAPSAAP